MQKKNKKKQINRIGTAVWNLSSMQPFSGITFSIFYQHTALSSRAVDGHQMYSGGSVTLEALSIDPEISPLFR